VTKFKWFFNMLIQVPFLVTSMAFGNWMLHSEGDSGAIGMLDREIEKRVSEPNKWGYTVLSSPSMSSQGLTYFLSFNVYLKGVRYSSIDEVERLYVDVYGDFLSKINSIRSIRPFLAEFPLTPSSVSLCLGFEDEKGKNLSPPYIVSAILKWDKLIFNQYIIGKEYDLGFVFKNIEERDPRKISGLKELYFPSVPRRMAEYSCKIGLIPNPSTSPYAKALFNFLKRFSKSNNLEFVTIGRVGETVNEIWPFEFALRGSQCLKLDEARVIAAKCFYEVWQSVKQDTRCIEYLKRRNLLPHFKDMATSPEPRHIAFRISFWDENVDRQPEPYIAEIRFLGGTFKYFTADEGQRLVLVHEETFDDALAFLNAQNAKTE
jgi:hypothetical protein